MAVKAGADPNKIIRGVDMSGRVCGKTGTGFDGVAYDLTAKPVAIWPNPFYYDYKLCAANCAHTSDLAAPDMAWSYKSTKAAFYCLPDLSSIDASVSVSVGGEFSSMAEAASNAAGDVITTMYYIFGSCFSAILFSFIMMPILRFLGKCLVLTSILSILIAGMAGGYFLYDYGVQGAKNGTLSDSNSDASKYTAFIIWGVCVIFLLVIFFLRKRILIAIAVVKSAAEAITTMPMLVVFPLWPVLIGCGYAAWWLYMAVYVWSVSDLTYQPLGLPDAIKYFKTPQFFTAKSADSGYSAGTILNSISTDHPNYYKFQRNTDWQYAAGFLIFHALWVVQFLGYFSYLAFAGATADWYFTPHDEHGHKKRGNEEDELSKWPIFSAVKRTARYHLGTVALCSFIIAVIQFIRICVLYVEKKCSSDPPNKLQKAVFCLLKCYLRCLECCMDKINKNALIWCAIWGDNFASSACSSFQLVWANLARVAAINIVSGILLLLSKVAISFVNAALFMAIFKYDNSINDELYAPLVPGLIIFWLSWMISGFFMVLLRSVIDSVFLCFLVDAETNPAGQMMAPDELQKLIGKYEGESKEIADAHSEIRKRRPGYKEHEGDTGDGKVLIKPKESIND